MTKKDGNKKIEIPAIEEMEEKEKKRERKRKKRMPVSGKEVFKEQELRIKNQESREGNDEDKLDT
jgi:hypothetical protein